MIIKIHVKNDLNQPLTTQLHTRENILEYVTSSGTNSPVFFPWPESISSSPCGFTQLPAYPSTVFWDAGSLEQLNLRPR